jgi:hypothetical protein
LQVTFASVWLASAFHVCRSYSYPCRNADPLLIVHKLETAHLSLERPRGLCGGVTTLVTPLLYAPTQGLRMRTWYWLAPMHLDMLYHPKESCEWWMHLGVWTERDARLGSRRKSKPRHLGKARGRSPHFIDQPIALFYATWLRPVCASEISKPRILRIPRAHLRRLPTFEAGDDGCGCRGPERSRFRPIFMN